MIRKYDKKGTKGHLVFVDKFFFCKSFGVTNL